MKPIFTLLTLLLGFCLAFTCSAQDVWTLEESINHAVQNSIGVKQAALSIQNASIDVSLSKQAKYPNLSASSGLAWNFGRSVDPTSNEFITETFFSNNYGLSSGVLLFDGFRLNNNIKKSEYSLKAANADQKQTEQDIALSVTVSYLNILFTKENIDIAKKQLLLNKQQLERVNLSITGGILPAAEKLNLEAQIAQSEQALIIAENSYDIAKLQLNQFLRLPLTEEIALEIPSEVDLSTDPDIITIDELLNKGIRTRYDLQAAEYRTKGAEKDVEIARSGYYPTLTMFGNLRSNYSNQAIEVAGFEPSIQIQNLLLNGLPVTVEQEIDRPILRKPSFGTQIGDFLSYGFGFSLNIPIYSNGITKGNIQRAQIGIENIKLQKQQLEENFTSTLLQALADAKAAKKKLEASDKSLAAQQAAFENVTKRLEIGATNSFEWESQKTQLENLEIQKLNDKYDYLFKIKILEFYLGKPLKF